MSKPSVAFLEEVESVVRRFRLEWNLTYSEAIGVLELVKHGLLLEAIEETEGCDDE